MQQVQQQHNQSHLSNHHLSNNNSPPTLPGLSALASIASSSTPQQRAFGNVGPSMTYATSSPSATSAGQGNSPPVCQNCTTSTTPLWRRDEIGSVLCNACGLFLKLHGKPRPISLKTDVIKSRNRVKSSGQGPKKKSLFDANGLSSSRSDAGTPPPAHFIHRRTSGKTSSRASNRSDSPVSRTATPAIHQGSNLASGVFDNNNLSEHGFHPSPSFPALHFNHASPGSTSSYNERHLEPPQSYEALQTANTALKTRVSELEIINDLFKGRVSQLEQSETSTRHSDVARRDGEDNLRQALDDSHRRESDLKRRIDELERDNADLREAAGPRPKKMRVSDIVDDELVPSTTAISSVS